MTSFANKMQIFLWQIATVILIKGTRASIVKPGFQTKSLPQTIASQQITPDEDTRTGVSKRWVLDAILCGDCIH